MGQTNTYIDKIFDILSSLNLTLCVCEYGTNGMVSSLLSKGNKENDRFIGSYIINSKKMLTVLGDINTNKISSSLSFRILRVTKCDICLTTYVSSDNLDISLVIIEKEFKKNFSLNGVVDKPAESTVLALNFLLTALEGAK
jgi:hypothetical protein